MHLVLRTRSDVVAQWSDECRQAMVEAVPLTAEQRRDAEEPTQPEIRTCRESARGAAGDVAAEAM